MCTDVCARGMDLKNVGLVVHFERSLTTESYIHRAGRAARGLNSGENLVLVGSAETQFLSLIGKFHGQENITQIETKQDEYDSAFEISKYAFDAVEVENRTWKMSQSTDKDEQDADEIGLV